MPRIFGNHVAFNYVPTVIDPLEASLETEVIVDNGPSPDGKAPTPQHHVFHRASVPASTYDLPHMRSFNIANLYADSLEPGTATVLLAYCPSGVLRAVMTKDERGEWDFEPIMEETNGAVSMLNSLRFAFGSLEDCREAYHLILTLRRAEHTNNHYPNMDRDAAKFVALMLKCPNGPRVLEVADPLRSTPLV